jgi:hypothetical protein
LALFFFGTFAPAALASERPMAIACLRLFTFFFERPLFSVPALRFFIARSTVLDAFLEYLRVLRAMVISPSGAELIGAEEDSSVSLRFTLADNGVREQITYRTLTSVKERCHSHKD